MNVENRRRQTDDFVDGNSLERGLHLAHFILRDRSVAIDVLTNALLKLKFQCRREKRRFYWRYKHPTRPIRRITRKQLDAFQWLIMYEAETHERRQEQLGNQSMRDMVVHYVKHIARITTSMSSFYVAVGMNRLLHNYDTSEIQTAYERVTRRFFGPDQYRRAKSLLTSHVKNRFGAFLETNKGSHGEVRFIALDNQNRWTDLVNECLSLFTPWSTNGLCSSLALEDGGDDTLAADGNDVDPNVAEMCRCHVFIEPVCRRRLLAALAFAPSESKLALPRFLIPDQQNGGGCDDSGGSQIAGLSPEEKIQIAERLAASDALRKGMHLQYVNVMVDGVERSRLDLTNRSHLRIELEEGLKLIEIKGRGDVGEVLLGTHLISYGTIGFESSEAFLFLKTGRIDLIVLPVAGVDNGCRATLTITFEPRFGLSWRTAAFTWGRIRAHALTGLATAAIVTAFASAIYTYRIRIMQKARGVEITGVAPRSIASYMLSPDDQRNRGVNSAGIPKISIHSGVGALELELPVSQQERRAMYRAVLTAFADTRELLSYNTARASQAPSGRTVTMIVPSSLLEPGMYYTVKLYSSWPNGQVEELNRFTFQVAADHRNETHPQKDW